MFKKKIHIQGTLDKKDSLNITKIIVGLSRKFL